MKIIAFRRNVGSPVALPPLIDIISDSAMTLPNRPLFLPDFSSEWEGYVAPAFRVSRLGKEIGRKFASRYYDAVALALRIVPVGGESDIHSDIFHTFDSCITLAPWQPIPADGNLSVEWENLSCLLTPDDLCIDETIEAVSHYCTLKTGDVIIPLSLSSTFPLRRDTVFTASLNSTPFTLKIK